MKATLEFTLPEESDSHEMAMHGADAFCALMDIRSLLRARSKGQKSDADTCRDIQKVLDQPIGNVEF